MSLAPYDLAGDNWEDMLERYLDMQLGLIEKHFGLNLRDHIKVAELNTPKDFERMLPHPRGAVYDLQNDIKSTASSGHVLGLARSGVLSHGSFDPLGLRCGPDYRFGDRGERAHTERPIPGVSIAASIVNPLR